LWRAAENGHKAAIRLLMARADVEINSRDKYDQTPLSRAAENGYKAAVRLLLARADVEINSKD
jgi:ankyrin repeat protein